MNTDSLRAHIGIRKAVHKKKKHDYTLNLSLLDEDQITKHSSQMFLINSKVPQARKS